MYKISILSIALGLAAVATAGTYHLTDLGALGGTTSFAYGVNAVGQVVGSGYTAGDAAQHAFLYSAGSMHDLGTLGGTNSFAYGLNATGQVVGTAYSAGNAAKRAFLYSGGTMQDLGTFGGTYSEAHGVNASGMVVGWAATGNGAHAFRYFSGSLQDLGALGGTYSEAWAINDSGQIGGRAYPAGDPGTQHAFLYASGTMQDLGLQNSIVEGVNSSGQVVGQFGQGQPLHAFIKSGGLTVDLGTLGGTYSEAYGINATGQTVGYAEIGNGSRHAFLYTGGAMQDLNELLDASGTGYSLQDAHGISDNGYICATGIIGNQAHAVLLTLNPVPEPMTMLALGAGALSLIRRRNRKN